MSKTAYTGGLFHRIVRRIAIRLQVAGVVLQHLPGYRATTGGIILIERDSTPDIYEEGFTKVGCDEMGDRVCEAL